MHKTQQISNSRLRTQTMTKASSNATYDKVLNTMPDLLNSKKKRMSLDLHQVLNTKSNTPRFSTRLQSPTFKNTAIFSEGKKMTKFNSQRVSIVQKKLPKIVNLLSKTSLKTPRKPTEPNVINTEDSTNNILFDSNSTPHENTPAYMSANWKPVQQSQL